jgi:hypothetical protein
MATATFLELRLHFRRFLLQPLFARSSKTAIAPRLLFAQWVAALSSFSKNTLHCRQSIGTRNPRSGANHAEKTTVLF